MRHGLVDRKEPAGAGYVEGQSPKLTPPSLLLGPELVTSMVAGLQELPTQEGREGLGRENSHSHCPNLSLLLWQQKKMGRTITTFIEGKRLCRRQHSLIWLEL